MKTLIPLSVLAAVAMTTTGCFVYERRAPARTVYVEPAVTTVTPVRTTVVSPVRETVVTTLPAGYRTRVYRGDNYYYSRNTYYRSYPRGGYVVVPRPW